MAQLPCIGLCKPCINLPFGECAMYFDQCVYKLFVRSSNHFFGAPRPHMLCLINLDLWGGGT